MALVQKKVRNNDKRLSEAIKYSRFNSKYFEDVEKIKKKISYERSKY